MGRDLPEYPTLFSKFADALIGANDDIVLPPETEAFDWEAELAVVIGAPVRRAATADGRGARSPASPCSTTSPAGTGSSAPGSGCRARTGRPPLRSGPYLVTPDELPGGVRPDAGASAPVDGETVQKDTTGDLLFDPVALVEYVSTMVTLQPGDVIATGTPGGVGHARKPPRYLQPGQVVTDSDRGPRRVPQHLRPSG